MTVSPAAPPLECETPETVLNALRARGLRASTARRLVIHALFSAEAPMSADQIARGLAADDTRLDIASVYRNLETLESLGVVRHFHAGHGPGRYVLTRTGEREYLACERCGAIAAVDSGELDRVRAEILERFGHRVRFAHFPMVGICAACSEDGAG
jgi:Fur family transcriptional regulator, ferric uptake regulator